MEQGRSSPRQRRFLHRREAYTGKEAANRSSDEQNPLSRGPVLETPVVRSRLDYKPDAVFVPDTPLRNPRGLWVYPSPTGEVKHDRLTLKSVGFSFRFCYFISRYEFIKNFYFRISYQDITEVCIFIEIFPL